MERERQQNAILQLEKKNQQFLAEQQAEFEKIVDKAVHDIRSPLQLMSSRFNASHELPEETRAVLQNAMNNTLKIIHGLARHYTRGVDSPLSETESRQDLLIADYVSEVLNDKRHQYMNGPIDFELHINEAAKTAHIDAQPGQLRRTLSNLLNNAVDALPEDKPGLIKVVLDADEKWVNIAICDNGQGVAPEAVQKIQNRIAFTENKANGHGLGLQQVWDTLEYNRGKMRIESTVGEGTSFKLSFPRYKSASWRAQEIVLYPDTMLLILEDEPSLHKGWEIRLGSIIGRAKALQQVRYFMEGEALLHFVSTLPEEEHTRILLLADYELTHQKLNGLQVIINSKIKNAILITGYTNNAEIRQAALEHGISLVFKPFLADMPIRTEKSRPA